MGYLADGKVYFTDVISSVYGHPLGFPNPDNQTVGDYPYMIYESQSWDRVCLSPNDMNFMLQNMDYVLIDQMAAPFDGKYPFNINLISETSTGIGYELARYVIYSDMGKINRRTIDPDDPILGK